MACMFHFARCMNIIFNLLMAQLVKYDVHTTRKIKSIHTLFITYYYYRSYRNPQFRKTSPLQKQCNRKCTTRKAGVWPDFRFCLARPISAAWLQDKIRESNMKYVHMSAETATHWQKQRSWVFRQQGHGRRTLHHVTASACQTVCRWNSAADEWTESPSYHAEITCTWCGTTRHLVQSSTHAHVYGFCLN